MESSPKIDSDLCDFPHYILPDTNVVLHQVDVLEDAIIKNVIVLQTVQQEVRHRSFPAYKRLKDIIANRDKKFYVFTNEHHRETFTERQPKETANDYSDRLIRLADRWYNNHLRDAAKADGKPVVKVVLLTNDIANKEKAQQEGLLAYTVHEYVKSLVGKPELVDRLAQMAQEEKTSKQKDQDITVAGGRKVLFPEHLGEAQIRSGIKSGKFKQGTFQASRENYREAYINVHNEEKQVFIKGLANQNRGVDSDVVAIEMLPKEQWSCPSSVMAVDESKKEEDAEKDFENEDTSNKAPLGKKAELLPTGRVIGVIKRNWRPYCGVLQPSSLAGTRHLFMAAERKIPKVRIETRQAASLQGCRIVVSIDSWPRNSRYPQGHFVRKLGEIGDKDTENEVLLLEHDVPHQAFSETVLSFLPKMPWCINKEDEDVREDLRWVDVASVDPPGCTDIDDALHCRHLDNGNLEVGVHIADVSHFIRPGNPLDEEAANRGTTVYLCDKRIDMVPDLLSSNLCSLRGGEERLAFSCIWEITEEADIIKTRFCKSIIKSRAAFTYEEAQLKIDDKSQQNALAKSLRGLNRLAKILKQKRLDNGALVLASSEVRFDVDSETHDPIDVIQKQARDTNSMVEEFMLLANISVAMKINEEFPQCALLRRHPTPAPSSYEPVIKAALAKGVQLEVDSGYALAKSLDRAVIESEPYFNRLLRMMTTRCMTQALYFSCGTLPEEEFVHYGLATPIYTHFTSPIRRYSDVIVHRMLAVAINADKSYPDLLDKMKIQGVKVVDILQAIARKTLPMFTTVYLRDVPPTGAKTTTTKNVCNNLNYRHRMAQYAGRASVNLHTQIFFKNKTLDEDGHVLFVRRNAVQVFIPKYGLEVTLFLKPDGEGRGSQKSVFQYNEEECTQMAGNVTLRMFDPVVVQVSSEMSNIQHQRLRVRLVKPYVPGFSVPSQETSYEPPTKKRKT